MTKFRSATAAIHFVVSVHIGYVLCGIFGNNSHLFHSEKKWNNDQSACKYFDDIFLNLHRLLWARLVGPLRSKEVGRNRIFETFRPDVWCTLCSRWTIRGQNSLNPTLLVSLRFFFQLFSRLFMFFSVFCKSTCVFKCVFLGCSFTIVTNCLLLTSFDSCYRRYSK